MTAQVRRASVSVAANIAEGWGRRSAAEFIRFLLIANGSLKEVETLLEVANRVGFVCSAAKGAIESRCSDVGRLLQALISSVDKSKQPRVRENVAAYGLEPNPEWDEPVD
jgi:four helix bundle protein